MLSFLLLYYEQWRSSLNLLFLSTFYLEKFGEARFSQLHFVMHHGWKSLESIVIADFYSPVLSFQSAER